MNLDKAIELASPVLPVPRMVPRYGWDPFDDGTMTRIIANPVVSDEPHVLEWWTTFPDGVETIDYDVRHPHDCQPETRQDVRPAHVVGERRDARGLCEACFEFECEHAEYQEIPEQVVRTYSEWYCAPYQEVANVGIHGVLSELLAGCYNPDAELPKAGTVSFTVRYSYDHWSGESDTYYDLIELTVTQQ